MKNTNIQAHLSPDTTGFSSRTLGVKYFELADYLGNVKEVISDRKLAIFDGGGDFEYFYADIVSFTDFYPFGSEIKSRTHNSDAYRMSFQGQESDPEIKGEGNSINYKYRMHDPRLGRFFAVDPLAWKYPYNSPYAFSENRVIDGVELEGLEYAPYDSDGNKLDINQEGWEGKTSYLVFEGFNEVKVYNFNGNTYLSLESLYSDPNYNYSEYGPNLKYEESSTTVPKEGTIEGGTFTRNVQNGKFVHNTTTTYSVDLCFQPTQSTVVNFTKQILFDQNEITELWAFYKNNNFVGDCIGYLCHGMEEITGVTVSWIDNYSKKTAWMAVDEIYNNGGGSYLNSCTGIDNNCWIKNTELEVYIKNDAGVTNGMYVVYAGQYRSGHSFMIAVNIDNSQVIKLDQYIYQNNHNKPQYWSVEYFIKEYLGSEELPEYRGYNTYFLRLWGE